MRSVKPPALATWLVEHLIPGERSEALAGDLLEQFGKGRSAAWYWREALVAIAVGFSKELCILWMAVGFTLLWISALSLFYGRIWSAALGEFLSLPWASGSAFAPQLALVPLINTIGFLTVVNALPLPAALGIYLRLTRSFTQRRFSRGLLVGLFTLAVGTLLGSLLLSTLPRSPAVSFELSRHSTSSWHRWGLAMDAIATLPVFFALLLSMWAARPNNPRRNSARVST
jgi:hypothetical protein